MKRLSSLTVVLLLCLTIFGGINRGRHLQSIIADTAETLADMSKEDNEGQEKNLSAKFYFENMYTGV